MKKNKFYIAYDEELKKRVPHVKIGTKYYSLITGRSFEETEDDVHKTKKVK